MNAAATRELVLRTLQDVAPDAEIDDLAPDEPIQEQLDFDSMDFLTFVTALAETTGTDVPEAEYRRLSTLDGCVAYFSS